MEILGYYYFKFWINGVGFVCVVFVYDDICMILFVYGIFIGGLNVILVFLCGLFFGMLIVVLMGKCVIVVFVI